MLLSAGGIATWRRDPIETDTLEAVVQPRAPLTDVLISATVRAGRDFSAASSSDDDE